MAVAGHSVKACLWHLLTFGKLPGWHLTGRHDTLHTLFKKRWWFPESCRASISGSWFSLSREIIQLRSSSDKHLAPQQTEVQDEIVGNWHPLIIFLQTGDFLDVAIFSWLSCRRILLLGSLILMGIFRHQPLVLCFIQPTLDTFNAGENESSSMCRILFSVIAVHSDSMHVEDTSFLREGEGICRKEGYASLDTGPAFKFKTFFCMCM